MIMKVCCEKTTLDNGNEQKSIKKIFEVYLKVEILRKLKALTETYLSVIYLIKVQSLTETNIKENTAHINRVVKPKLM